MAYSASTVANFFIDKASSEGRAVTPMQLIKLVYIAHGWHLGYFSKPLINETVQAWRYGPVVKSLYDKVKRYGSGAVSEPVQTTSVPWSRDTLDAQTQSLLDSVWSAYAGFSGIQLSAMTHQLDTPWYEAWHLQGGSSQYFAEISDDVIERHYKQKISQSRPEAALA
ncbi:Panacea domain-containing protein [Arenimonas oryziterrae]|nr:type II toxin-antitoxin system antitoxin SocA domain-containing protein [Arenimonas oryziterrae]